MEQHERTDRGAGKYAHRLVAVAVLVAGMATSLGIAQVARDDTRRDARLRFDAAAASAAGEIERRFAAYVEVLAGLRALFQTGDVSREAFGRYAMALDLKQGFPGFDVLNYAPHVPPSTKDAFEISVRRSLREADFDRFAIYPPGVRDGYDPLTLIAPMAGNEQLLGKDLAALPSVRDALDAARDTGKLTASGKLINRGADGHVALAMRLPVYRPGQPLDTVERRRAAFVGTVGAGFQINTMFGNLPEPAQGVRLRLFDGGIEAAGQDHPVPQSVRPDSLLFDTGHGGDGDRSGDSTGASRAEGFHRYDAFGLGGRRWIVESAAPFEQGVGAFERLLPGIILAGGVVISGLLAGFLFSLMGSQRRATSLAYEMTRSLRDSEQRLAEAQALAKMGSWVFDARSGDLHCSDEACRIYGLGAPTAPLTLQCLLALTPASQRDDLRNAIERALHSDTPVEVEHSVQTTHGAERWVHVNLQRSVDADGVTVCAMVRDETARKKAAQRLELAHDIAKMLAAEADTEKAIDFILSSIGARLQWHAAVCWSRDAVGPMRCLRTWASNEEAAPDDLSSAMQRDVSWRATGHPELAETLGEPQWRDLSHSDIRNDVDRIASRSGLRTALVVPVDAGAEFVALEFFSRASIGVDDEILGFMRSVSSQLAQYLQRKQAERALRQAANHDGLTGLASRSLLEAQLTQAMQHATRQQQQVAVLFMDLDRFKHVNDSLGHSAGDALLRAFAGRLRGSVREGDTVARFGGDEFVVVLEGLSSPADAAGLLDKMLLRFGDPFDVQGREINTSACVGVSMFPEDGQDVESLLMHADAAMYRAKERGAGTYEFHSAHLSAQGPRQFTLESSLHRALEREELFLVYQPKLDLATGRVTGVEALMRWQHATLGLVSPVHFIPIAEATGLIDSMGHWALGVACRDARRWHDAGLPVQVSVNLSARQLSRPDLAVEVAEVLAQSRLPPDQLELEITESGVMRNPAAAAAQLRTLRDLGVSLAIDDFGTGYSSLSYLQRFPLGTLKIDRSFIKDLPGDSEAAALTTGIIGLAHGLHMKVVAEGVETLEQLAFLRANRCDQIQGYYLSKPISADEMHLFLARDVRNLVSPVIVA